MHLTISEVPEWKGEKQEEELHYTIEHPRALIHTKTTCNTREQLQDSSFRAAVFRVAL